MGKLLKRHAQTLAHSRQEELVKTVRTLLAPGKGILAADESVDTFQKRVEELGIKNTEENRRQYRQMLFTSQQIEQYISGAILFHSTVYQKADDGTPLVKVLQSKGIVPGIKVDKGLSPLFGSKFDVLPQGLSDLNKRCAEYKKEGCLFAKWRSAFRIRKVPIPHVAIMENSVTMARYARICQNHGIVPIVEPEVLPIGNHDIVRCQKETEAVLAEMFKALYDRNVFLEGILLKPNMITHGQGNLKKSVPEEVARCTVEVFQRRVPAAVPGIVLLSGGQSEEEATVNLNAIVNHEGSKPWVISYSFGRALQNSALNTWKGKKENVAAAQREFLKRAKANSEAAMGRYKPGSAQGASEQEKLTVDDFEST